MGFPRASALTSAGNDRLTLACAATPGAEALLVSLRAGDPPPHFSTCHPLPPVSLATPQEQKRGFCPTGKKGKEENGKTH
ncbi:hypothetical protein C7E16_13855 [Acinetobacter radioresistens]|nr:hypothetical protein CQA21_18700 [Proteus mirabilis]PCQ35859.1 hypothetical protein CQA26_22160 [Providencia rettgeri]PSD34735.1 hypothetical protein C7E16_13855 [Acinetobacter radioresistens]